MSVFLMVVIHLTKLIKKNFVTIVLMIFFIFTLKN